VAVTLDHLATNTILGMSLLSFQLLYYNKSPLASFFSTDSADITPETENNKESNIDLQTKVRSAKQLYSNALEIFQRTFGPENSTCGITTNNLGLLSLFLLPIEQSSLIESGLSVVQSGTDESEKLLLTAYQIFMKALGESHRLAQLAKGVCFCSSIQPTVQINGYGDPSFIFLFCNTTPRYNCDYHHH
jgi:hypothetical protein